MTINQGVLKLTRTMAESGITIPPDVAIALLDEIDAMQRRHDDAMQNCVGYKQYLWAKENT